jgi:hypothetical protein
MIQTVLGMSKIPMLYFDCFTDSLPSDAFAAGFVAGVVQGSDLATCVDMGQWIAKLSIQELGPSYPMNPKQVYSA